MRDGDGTLAGRSLAPTIPSLFHSLIIEDAPSTNTVLHGDVVHGASGAASLDPAALLQPLEHAERRRAIDAEPIGQLPAGQPTIALEQRQDDRFKVPLPPREEQLRIVKKVEQLMLLCDRLEAPLQRAEDRSAKLVEAVVQELMVAVR